MDFNCSQPITQSIELLEEATFALKLILYIQLVQHLIWHQGKQLGG